MLSNGIYSATIAVKHTYLYLKHIWKMKISKLDVSHRSVHVFLRICHIHITFQVNCFVFCASKPTVEMKPTDILKNYKLKILDKTQNAGVW